MANHDLVLGQSSDLALGHDRGDLVIEQVHGLGLAHRQTLVQARALIASPEHQLAVGQEFSDVKSCRRAIRDAAIACRFEIQTVKSDKTRFTAKCAAEGCPWRIHAAKLPGVPTFTIRTIHDSHSCAGINHLGHHQASVQWVANSVEERIRENPHCKPKEILEEIHRTHGITLSYKQAWRGKEMIMAAVRGSFEEGYRLLPQYCEQVKGTNPGSIANVYGNPDDNCFRRLFVSFYASIYGFVNACRPLIGLDRTILKSKYLAPCFIEANTENMPRLTILSDRQRGIVDGVEFNFPTAFHGFCMRTSAKAFAKSLTTQYSSTSSGSSPSSYHHGHTPPFDDVVQRTARGKHAVVSALVPSAERRMSEYIERARGYQVGRANEAEFEVVSPHEGVNIVDIRNRRCLCRGWQLCGLPCAHGVAALLSCRQNVHRYTESYFTVATYRKTYSQTIHPIPDRSLWNESSETCQDGESKIEIVINPPKSVRPAGKPRKREFGQKRAEEKRGPCTAVAAIRPVIFGPPAQLLYERICSFFLSRGGSKIL
uniref:SWIM-type domain-containing protein n=1 Tax=Ananas comosus var. bracteatus TaxID=296719 RepID=A0A6V7QFX8_ANACO|nr:unnamed protein product [Ananas comosus var. bracteatus]